MMTTSTTLAIAPAPMAPERFADWLRGFLDACGDKPTKEQVAEIRKKLDSVSAQPYQAPPIHVYPVVTPAPVLDPSRWTAPIPTFPSTQPPWPYCEPFIVTCDAGNNVCGGSVDLGQLTYTQTIGGPGMTSP